MLDSKKNKTCKNCSEASHQTHRSQSSMRYRVKMRQAGGTSDMVLTFCFMLSHCFLRDCWVGHADRPDRPIAVHPVLSFISLARICTSIFQMKCEKSWERHTQSRAQSSFVKERKQKNTNNEKQSMYLIAQADRR